ncbi:Protein of unknown function [Desulfonatronum zhilinae]|nr:Protein of unknown function [Desulfonatronum zhilinae]
MQTSYFPEYAPDIDQEFKSLDDPTPQEQEPAQSLVRTRILVAEHGLLVAMTETGPVSCKVAASCLVQPEAGDLALVSLSGRRKDAAYVLAVLERAAPDTVMHIDLAAGARMNAAHGPVEIMARTDLRLRAGDNLEAEAPSMSFAATTARWLTHTFSLLGKTVEAVCSVWRESSTDRETTAETWTQRLGDCHRHVQDLDETQAGTSRTLARDTALLHGRVSYVQAEEFVKVDGQEVHLG